MKSLINDNFLLENNTALNLYNDYAKDLPIVDYHCHIESKEIAEDVNYENITKLWLGGDHYKWRLMRACGIDEKFITKYFIRHHLQGIDYFAFYNFKHEAK